MQIPIRRPPAPRTLAATIALMFIGQSAVGFLLAGGLNIVASLRSQQAALAAEQQLIAQQAGRTVTGFIEAAYSALETIVELSNPVAADAEGRDTALGGLLGRQPAFRQLALLDSRGRQLAQLSRLSAGLSSQFAAQLRGDVMTRTQEGSRFFSPIYIDDASSEPVVVLAVPVTDIFGDYQGTLVSELNLKFMWDLVGGIEVGESGYAYVVDDLGNLIAFQDSARVLRGENLAAISEVQEFVSDPSETSDELTSGVTAYIGLNAARVVGTHLALGTPRWAVVIEQPWDEAYRPIIVLAAWGLIIILGVMIVSGLVSIPVSRILSAPLVDLSGVAEQVASGNLTLQAKAAGPLEIRRVATTFNDMTSRLRELIGTLEERVADRTRALAASAEVSRRLSTILDQSQLVVEVVDQVQRAFGYYHAHIYLVDEATGDLVMAGGTGEAGKIMLARGHRIPKGKGLVGRAAETGAPVLAADVTSDPDWLSNPLLPETRSEAAVPISLGAQTVGVLDVQQNVAGGLEQADIDLLQSIANQVAIAVQNARTYTEVRRQAEREALIARIGAQIQSATRVDEALKVAVREVGRALGTQATVRLAGHPGEDGRKRAAGRRKADR